MLKNNRFTSLALCALIGASSSPALFAEEEVAVATPEVSETEMIEVLGYVTVFQAGMKELGLTVDDAEALSAGIARGLSDAEPDPAVLAKMPAFQEFVQGRLAAAQAKVELENAAAAEGKIAESAALFEALKSEEGVESTESGLYYKVIESGSDAKPSMDDSVLVHYKGTLIDGTQFDSSYDRGQPATFPLNGVVKGFGEGLTKVGAGGKITLYIPSELGYGNNPRPGGVIKAGDTLIFECELIEVNPGS
jgi:FKBP-type peptidyl-prolyl cis-trans isomerase